MFGDMKPHEDKEKICRQLLKLLQSTRDQSALKELRYEKTGSEEYVSAVYLSGGTRRICVTFDSGIELIRDVVRALK